MTRSWRSVVVRAPDLFKFTLARPERSVSVRWRHNRIATSLSRESASQEAAEGATFHRPPGRRSGNSQATGSWQRGTLWRAGGAATHDPPMGL